MQLSVGQKVAYPGQGVCVVERLEQRDVMGKAMRFYLLRVCGDDSQILVPESNADSVGLRPVISQRQCRRLIDQLAEDFDDVSGDWKQRSRQFMEKLQSGDVFEAADVLKKLTYLSHYKKLSFREQNLLEKAKWLIVSEIVNSSRTREELIEPRIYELVETACSKHIENHAGEFALH
ncbi:MAG: CarD family transcriptional regulator [Pyrinomonadaceae bacterium]